MTDHAPHAKTRELLQQPGDFEAIIKNEI